MRKTIHHCLVPADQILWYCLHEHRGVNQSFVFTNSYNESPLSSRQATADIDTISDDPLR
ncbi:uncharacterized protein FOMMEDRAFT_16930 [Fomitiporia mediterranea MF3/22]|uniref:uncharacterized protein n=1 Tax=Fomitiporia mediterranea (strain MF3/22) TaxID=694068 RepID=UPI0004408382|nr:uncharacterized protein FOMMEDRAFT_16930 [Fomitiporia mediterranea MF3/22]EJD06314.1 hypothetical protein FOMMEDRAFT_16930 [Fomitiporia mediterranea MF3/22]